MNMVLGDLIGAVTGVVNPIVKPLTQPFKELGELTNEFYDDNDDLMELSRHHSRSASLVMPEEIKTETSNKTSPEEVKPELTNKTSNDFTLEAINRNLNNILIGLDKMEKFMESLITSKSNNMMIFISLTALSEVIRINVDKIKNDVTLLSGKKTKEGEDNGC